MPLHIIFIMDQKENEHGRRPRGQVLIPAILSHAKPVCRNQQTDMILIAKSEPIDSGKGCIPHMSLTNVNNKQLHRAHIQRRIIWGIKKAA